MQARVGQAPVRCLRPADAGAEPGRLVREAGTMSQTSQAIAKGDPVRVTAGPVALEGNLGLPERARGVVLFAHGSGSSRHSPRNRFVAEELSQGGLATLLIDLLTPQNSVKTLGVFALDLSPQILKALPRLRRSKGVVIASVSADAPFSQQGRLLPGDIIYGANDGIITTFAVVAGVAGGGLSHSAVLIVGAANLAADGLSMAVGNFLSIRAHESFCAPTVTMSCSRISTGRGSAS